VSTAHPATPPAAPVPGAAAPTHAHAQETGLAKNHGVVQSSDLLGQQQAILIEHNGQRYRLQATRSGKLILTK
jgi:hemin uptake protein HemP